MSGLRAVLPVAALVLSALVLAACSSETTTLSGEAVVSDIPWPETEELHYRLMEGDALKGSGIISIEPQAGTLLFRQKYASDEFTDEIVVVANGETIQPISVRRLLVGPDGQRNWAVNYGSGSARVIQRTKDDKRDDRLAVPARSYDSWTDIFLWRTIDFRAGYHATYTDVLSATLAEPEVISQELKVTGKEEVTVPAGVFDAWRVEIHAPDGDQVAWYADTDDRPLVRYDNGSLVFELLSLFPD
jgi:hypothetical protein